MSEGKGQEGCLLTRMYVFKLIKMQVVRLHFPITTVNVSPREEICVHTYVQPSVVLAY